MKEGIITHEFSEMLLQWNHNSGFNVHTRGRIDGMDKEAIESVARYMSRAPLSVERVEFNPQECKVIVYEKKNKSCVCVRNTYDVLEFMALLSSHIPSVYEPLVYYYGIYSSSHLGKEKRDGTQEKDLVIIQTKAKKKASASSWAKLIYHIFENDPTMLS